MENTFISPATGEMPKDYRRPKASHLDQDKSSFLNKILRGEYSAVEAYEQVIPTFKNERDRFLLSGIRNEHDRNIEKLKMLVERTHYEPNEESGTWGTMVSTIVGAANLMGNTAALKALEEGEQHGLKLYQEGLKYSLTDDERDIFILDFIPGLERHIASLRNIIANQNDN